MLKTCAIAALVAAAALLVVYRAVNRVPAENLPQNERVLAIFEDGGCMKDADR